MAINHDKIREAVEAHKRMSGHDVQYHDGGAEKRTLADDLEKDLRKLTSRYKGAEFERSKKHY